MFPVFSERCDRRRASSRSFCVQGGCVEPELEGRRLGSEAASVTASEVKEIEWRTTENWPWSMLEDWRVSIGTVGETTTAIYVSTGEDNCLSHSTPLTLSSLTWDSMTQKLPPKALSTAGVEALSFGLIGLIGHSIL